MRGASGHIACYIFEEKRVNHAICPPFKILHIKPFIIATQFFMTFFLLLLLILVSKTFKHLMETSSTEKIFPFLFVPFSLSSTLQNNAVTATDRDFSKLPLQPVPINSDLNRIPNTYSSYRP